jgi:hypothetical protein
LFKMVTGIEMVHVLYHGGRYERPLLFKT